MEGKKQQSNELLKPNFKSIPGKTIKVFPNTNGYTSPSNFGNESCIGVYIPHGEMWSWKDQGNKYRSSALEARN